MIYKEKETKTIINVKKFIDPWFWDRYTLSAYSGCEFQCIYCYARAGKYAKNFNHGNIIYIKKDAAGKLDSRLTRTRTLLPDITGMSGVCDPYQPCENQYNNTRACIEVLGKHKYPVNVLTKSDLVLRDIDLFSEIAEKSWMGVSFTITSLKDDVVHFLEPLAHSPSERLAPKKSYISQKSKKIYELLDKYSLPARLKRFIPEDYRKYNYIISEKLLNEACYLQDIGKTYSNLYWAGMNIQNLKQDIRILATQGTLKTIRNVNEDVEKKVNSFLKAEGVLMCSQ